MITKIHIEDNGAVFTAEVRGSIEKISALIIELSEKDEQFQRAVLLAAEFLRRFPAENEKSISLLIGVQLINLTNNIGKQ